MLYSNNILKQVLIVFSIDNVHCVFVLNTIKLICGKIRGARKKSIFAPFIRVWNLKEREKGLFLRTLIACEIWRSAKKVFFFCALYSRVKFEGAWKRSFFAPFIRVWNLKEREKRSFFAHFIRVWKLKKRKKGPFLRTLNFTQLICRKIKGARERPIFAPFIRVWNLKEREKGLFMRNQSHLKIKEEVGISEKYFWLYFCIVRDPTKQD